MGTWRWTKASPHRNARGAEGLRAEARAWKPTQDLRPCHGGKRTAGNSFLQEAQHSTSKTVGHIKMQVIGDFKASTIMKAGTGGNADVTTDWFCIYVSLERGGAVAFRHAIVADYKKSVGKVLPWVHIAISNAKRNILDTYMT